MISLPRAATLALGSLLLGCHVSLSFTGVEGSGILVSEVRTAPTFSEVHLGTNADVHIQVGPDTTIEIEGDDNLLPLVSTKVSGNALKISNERSYRTRRGISVRITTPTLTSVRISGSGEVQVEGATADVFEAKISGSGDMNVRGQVKKLEASITGSGDLDLEDLKAESANARISGSGDIRLHVDRELTYRISGSGDIRYSGAGQASGSISGSGEVSRAR